MLVLLIFLVWILWVVASIANHRLRGIKSGLPPELRPGLSILPIFPVLPLACWGIAVALDRVAAPWGTRTVGAVHVLFGLALLVDILRSVRERQKLGVRL